MMLAPTLLALALSAAPVQGGHVLTLAEAEQQALAHQPALAQSAAQTEVARARVTQARSPLFPQVSASASYGLTTNNRSSTVLQTGTGADGSGTGTTPTTTVVNSTPGNLTAGIGVSQLIWDFGATTGQLRAAEHALDAQKESEAVSQRDVLNTVRVAFFAARAAEDELSVAQELLDNQQRHLKQIEAFVRVGTRPEIDLAQAKTDVANAQLSMVRANNSVSLSQTDLERAMGVKLPRPFTVSREAIGALPYEDVELEALVQKAMENRGELRAYEAQLAAQESSVGAIRGAYFPRLGVSADASGSGLGTNGSDYDFGATGRVTLSWQIFNGFETNAAVQVGNANLRAIEAQRDSELQQIRYEVEQAALTVRAARAAVSAATEAETNAKERLRLAEGRYSAGVGNVIELADAQLQAAQAASQRVQTEYDLSVARAQLQRALGGA